MVNIQDKIVEQLQTILPCYYDLFLNPASETPCLSWQVLQNTEVARGNLNGYSLITFRVKIWATTVEEICSISEQVDDKMAELGRFIRTSVGELTDGELICSMVDYQITVSEYYTNYRPQ